MKWYYAGDCPRCQQYGELYIAKHQPSGRLCFCCDECSDVWWDPDRFRKIPAHRPGTVDEPFGISLVDLGGTVEPASLAEIEAAGWSDWIKSESSRSDPFYYLRPEGDRFFTTIDMWWSTKALVDACIAELARLRGSGFKGDLSEGPELFEQLLTDIQTEPVRVSSAAWRGRYRNAVQAFQGLACHPRREMASERVKRVLIGSISLYLAGFYEDRELVLAIRQELEELARHMEPSLQILIEGLLESTRSVLKLSKGEA